MYFLKDMNPFLLNKWVDCYGTVRHQKTAVSTKFACFRNKIAALKRREGEGRIKRSIMASAFLSSKKKSPKTDNFYHFTFCQSMPSLWADETALKKIEKSGNTIVGPSSGREVCNRSSKQYCAIPPKNWHRLRKHLETFQSSCACYRFIFCTSFHRKKQYKSDFRKRGHSWMTSTNFPGFWTPNLSYGPTLSF